MGHHYLFTNNMGLNPKKIASGILAITLASLALTPFLSARGDTNKAVEYIKTKTLGSWGAMALAAVGETADVSSLKSIDSTKAIDYEAPILALTAQGKNPRTYPNTDYVAKLITFWDGTQLGAVSTFNDDIFGLLALRSANVPPSDTVLTGIKSYLLSNQNADGGWAFASGDSSDTNTTAAAIMALVEAGLSPSHEAISKAVTFLKSAQNTDGGFPYDPKSPWGTDSDDSSDAFVIAAANKLGQDPRSWQKNGKNPVDHLLSLQDSTGFFRYQATSAEDSYAATATAYAIIALSGKSLPIKIYTAPASPHVTYRIAGKNTDVCVGETNAPNPLQLLKDVAASCGTDYHIQELSFGPYLDRIGSDTATGDIGWMYTVNSLSPSVGAGDYVLKTDDEVLWYFADYRDLQTRLSLTNTQVEAGSSATAIVESFDGTSWKPLPAASVYAANTIVPTGSDGKAVLTLPSGTYKIYAAQTGYVRSPAKTLVVGTKVQNEFPLTVTIPDSGNSSGGGSANGTNGLSFTLTTPTSETGLGFGTLQVGAAQSKMLTITNQSTSRIHIEALVTGSDVFRNYLTINNAPWRLFSDKIDGTSSKNETVGLSIPASYTSAGQKTGALTIWATTAN
jgi:hypothetical protein